jgi:predicted SAM-dependent methyltransferase
MTNLNGIESGSVDLVWSGQSIEHVTEEQGIRMCSEALRVLKPGGRFCLDTPNRLITELHAATVGGGFVHPDHKIEYTPDHLRKILRDSGFDIKEEWGVCEMPLTAISRSFSYDDFVIGGAITKNINDAYIQFFHCEKPLS